MRLLVTSGPVSSCVFPLNGRSGIPSVDQGNCMPDRDALNDIGVFVHLKGLSQVYGGVFFKLLYSLRFWSWSGHGEARVFTNTDQPGVAPVQKIPEGRRSIR